ncbi:MAG TPA: gamma-glutamylcyclotransferase [Clostridia bacterium]|nr:gamma-glutamylcyclotransferase [Clostridia bacterium]
MPKKLKDDHIGEIKKLFVYGTLMRGFPNYNKYLKDKVKDLKKDTFMVLYITLISLHYWKGKVKYGGNYYFL